MSLSDAIVSDAGVAALQLTRDGIQELGSRAAPKYGAFACVGTDENGVRQAGTLCTREASGGCKKEHGCDAVGPMTGLPVPVVDRLKADILDDVNFGQGFVETVVSDYGDIF